MVRRCSICRQPGHDARNCPLRPAAGRDAPACRGCAEAQTEPRIEIRLGDNLPLLAGLDSGSFDLIYVDPPFNTNKIQSRRAIRTRATAGGDRQGFQGRRYRTEVLGEKAYRDRHDDDLGFLLPRLGEAHRLLAARGKTPTDVWWHTIVPTRGIPFRCPTG
jgi:hypothetical protein